MLKKGNTDIWLEQQIRNGLVCRDYTKKVAMAENRYDLSKILFDVNGLELLPSLKLKGIDIPTEDLLSEYGRYLNGYKHYYNGYSSTMYVRNTESIITSTTLLGLVECKCEIIIPKNNFPRLIVDKDCELTISMHPTSRLRMEVYGDAKYSISGDMGRVDIKQF